MRQLILQRAFTEAKLDEYESDIHRRLRLNDELIQMRAGKRKVRFLSKLKFMKLFHFMLFRKIATICCLSSDSTFVNQHLVFSVILLVWSKIITDEMTEIELFLIMQNEGGVRIVTCGNKLQFKTHLIRRITWEQCKIENDANWASHSHPVRITNAPIPILGLELLELELELVGIDLKLVRIG